MFWHKKKKETKQEAKGYDPFVDLPLKFLVKLFISQAHRIAKPYIRKHEKAWKGYSNPKVRLLDETVEEVLKTKNWHGEAKTMLSNLKDIICTILNDDNAMYMFFMEVLKKYNEGNTTVTIKDVTRENFPDCFKKAMEKIE